MTRLVRPAVFFVVSLICFGATAVPTDWAEAVRRFRASDKAAMSNQWAEAQREMSAVATVYPGSAGVQYGLAQYSARAGDSRSSIAALSRALTLGFHNFLTDDAELTSLHSAPEWPGLVRKYETAEKRWRSAHSDPDRVAIHTEDISRFWLTWDRARRLPPEEWPPLFVNQYLNAGTEGLREYYLGKCREPQNFANAIRERAEYYEAIRPATMRVEADQEAIRESFRKLKGFYRDAVFPDIYFVIGQLTSGGTASLSGLLIGVEMSTAGPDTPRGSLSDWQKANVSSADRLPGLIAHELIHFQVKGSSENSLLTQVLLEGSADFVASKIARVVPDREREDYVKAHEAEIWDRFRAEKDGTDTQNWMYGSPKIAGMPSDVGYWVGARICDSYYERATDKTAALRDIIEQRNPRQIFAQSEFAK